MFKSNTFSYNWYRKCKRFYWFIVSTFLILAKFRIKDYDSPPSSIEEVGFFDKSILLHVKSDYENLIHPENLYRDGKYKGFKNEKVKLVYDGEKLLIKKKFSGYRKYFELYCELKGLNKLKETEIVPSLEYVDYENCAVYLEYIDGINLSSGRKNIQDYFESFEENIQQNILEALKLIHQYGIILNDIGTRNLMVYQNRVYVIDFADALFFANIDSLPRWKAKIFQNMKAEDIEKVNRDIRKIIKKT